MARCLQAKLHAWMHDSNMLLYLQAGDKRVLTDGSLEWVERACPALWDGIQRQPALLLADAQPAAQLLEEVGEVMARGAQVLGALDGVLMPLVSFHS